MKKTIAWTDEMSLVDGCGYRIYFVTEGDDGFRPTGDWPYDGKDHGQDMSGATRPWFWGQTLEEARAACDRYNLENRVTHEEAVVIVGRAMFPKKRKQR